MIGLGDSQDLYRGVVELCTDALMVADVEANILSVSPRTVEIFGYDRSDEMVGLSGFEFFIPEDRQRAGANFQRRFLSGKLGYVDYTFVKKDGSQFPGEMNVSPFNDPDGNIKGVVAVVRDVTELKATYSELLDTSERLEATLSALPDLMFEVDVEGRIFDYRAPRDELLYVPPENFTRRLLTEVIPPDAAGIIMEAVTEAAQTGKSSGATYSLEMPDGIQWFELSVASKGEPGQPGGHVVALVRDITERKQVEKALQESEERFRTVADFTYDFEIWKTPDGRIAYVSPSCQRITGYSRAEFTEDPGLLLKITHPDDREALETHVDRAQSSQHVMQIDFRIIDREGSEHWISHVCQPVYRKDGTPYGRRDSNRPLASIAMSIELLEGLVAEPSSKATRSDMSEIIGTTRKSLSRALALIDDLLSNAEAGEKPALTTSVDVAGVVQTLLEEQAPLIESCQARMLVDPDMGGIVADPVHIYQLFSNLITNALRYCDSTHPDIEIRFLGDDDTGAHRYLVRDNGAGIPADAMGRIFEPFFKGPDGESGIGLAIVDKIVRMYDGDIKAYNDGGACFEFLLRDYQS